MINFYKYHGAGNDFILIDNISGELNNLSDYKIQKFCHRNFGIGADGLMVLKHHKKFDFEMEYYNSDGSGGTMCGNGGRCIVAFAKKLGIINSYTKFIASDGVHEAFIDENNIVKLKMSDVNELIKLKNGYTSYTGSPHYIRFEDNIKNIDVYSEGKKIRNSPTYKEEGINVNFVKIEDKNTISIRTFERGVENETLACGTGSVAAALCFANINNDTSGEYVIKARGGTLKVSFEFTNNIFTNIWLEGPTAFVFEGNID